MAMKKENEQRRKVRVEFRSEATVTYKEKTITGNISNLSMKGLLLESTERFPVDETVDITIKLSGSTTDLSVRILGKVLRHEENGMAIEFKEMELDSFIHLRNIVFYADRELHEFYEFF
jgi:hypothetical protein